VQRGALDAGTASEAGASSVDEASWLQAPPLADHVLVNLGDMLARWTNGRYRSTVHRVMLQRGEAPRHSVAFFANPTYYATVRPFPSCCAPVEGMPPPRYESITAGKYISGRLGLMYVNLT
jgi:isopenicillin N synthase-like dioxygenase